MRSPAEAGPLSRSGKCQNLDKWIAFYHVNPRFIYVVYYLLLPNQWINHTCPPHPRVTHARDDDARRWLIKMMDGWMTPSPAALSRTRNTHHVCVSRLVHAHRRRLHRRAHFQEPPRRQLPDRGSRVRGDAGDGGTNRRRARADFGH